MSKQKLAAAALTAAVVFSTSSALAETLRVGSETVYPPFEYLDSKSGQYVGFDMDLIDAIGKRAGFDVKIYSMGLDGLIPALMSSSIDVAVSALTITPQRAEKVDFTDPYYKSGLSIMTHKENAGKIKGPEDLHNKTLCAEIGSAGALYSSKLPGVTVRTFNSAAEAFMEISLKGCYAMINDKPVNEYFLVQRASQTMNLAEVPVILSADNYGFAVKKGNTALRERLNKGLREVIADGTYERIHMKWFGVKPDLPDAVRP